MGQVLGGRDVGDGHVQHVFPAVAQQLAGLLVDVLVAPFLAGDEDGIGSVVQDAAVACLAGDQRIPGVPHGADVLDRDDDAANLAVHVVPGQRGPAQPHLAAVSPGPAVAIAFHSGAVQAFAVHLLPRLWKVRHQLIQPAPDQAGVAAPVVLEPSVAVGQVDHVPVEHRDAERRAPDEGLHLGLRAPELLFGLLALVQPARELPDSEQRQHGDGDGDRRCRQRGSGLAVELHLRDGDDHAKAGRAGARHGCNDGQSLQAECFKDRRFPMGQLGQGLFRQARADEAIGVPAAGHDCALAIEYRGRPSRRKVLGQQNAAKLFAVHRR